MPTHHPLDGLGDFHYLYHGFPQFIIGYLLPFFIPVREECSSIGPAPCASSRVSVSDDVVFVTFPVVPSVHCSFLFLGFFCWFPVSSFLLGSGDLPFHFLMDWCYGGWWSCWSGEQYFRAAWCLLSVLCVYRWVGCCWCSCPWWSLRLLSFLLFSQEPWKFLSFLNLHRLGVHQSFFTTPFHFHPKSSAICVVHWCLFVGHRVPL